MIQEPLTLPLQQVEVDTGVSLVVCRGDVEGLTMPLKRVCVILTREGPDHPSFIVLPDPTISRGHAALCWVPQEQCYRIYQRSGVTNSMRSRDHGDVQGLSMTLGLRVDVGQVSFTFEPTPPPVQLDEDAPPNPRIQTQGLTVSVEGGVLAGRMMLLNRQHYKLSHIAPELRGDLKWDDEAGAYRLTSDQDNRLVEPGTAWQVGHIKLVFHALTRGVLTLSLQQVLSGLGYLGPGGPTTVRRA